MKLSPKRAELLAVARDMLDGKTHLIEGVRRINSLRFDVGEPDSEVFIPIRAVDSETDHFPLGSVRNQYAADALRRVDAEMNLYLAEANEEILAACKEIIRVFSK